MTVGIKNKQNHDGYDVRLIMMMMDDGHYVL